jgi:hypothetical protein
MRKGYAIFSCKYGVKCRDGHIKQHQLHCLMGEHSWCFISEIRAICAVIYGVLAFTPPY